MTTTSSKIPKGTQELQALPALSMLFCTALVISNVVSVKLISAGPLILPAGIIVFPLCYIFGDVLTEVYGFERTRTVIWWGLGAQVLAAGYFWVAIQLPSAPFWKGQQAFATVLGLVPRIVGAGLVSYLVGEYLNSVVMSRMKVRHAGRHFWWRAVASTFVGQGVDSALFNALAFSGIAPARAVLTLTISGWMLKLLYEVLALPVTYRFSTYLKRLEGIDHFDTDVRYTLLGSSGTLP